jgi:hypothetical protein
MKRREMRTLKSLMITRRFYGSLKTRIALGAISPGRSMGVSSVRIVPLSGMRASLPRRMISSV